MLGVVRHFILFNLLAHMWAILTFIKMALSSSCSLPVCVAKRLRLTSPDGFINKCPLPWLSLALAGKNDLKSFLFLSNVHL